MDTQIDSSGDNTKDLGTARIREAGCGILYVINFEDTDEQQFEVDLDRAEAERLYAILGKMLEKPAPTPALLPTPNWINGAVTRIPPPWQWPRY